MPPEPSKLNWSTVKPTFEEVEGKTVYIETKSTSGIVVRFSRIVKDFEIFNIDFDNRLFIRYAILDLSDPDPEPQPLWGGMPEIVNVGKKTVVCLVIPDKYYFEIQRFDRAEAVNAWNKLAKPLNEIQP